MYWAEVCICVFSMISHLLTSLPASDLGSTVFYSTISRGPILSQVMSFICEILSSVSPYHSKDKTKIPNVIYDLDLRLPLWPHLSCCPHSIICLWYPSLPLPQMCQSFFPKSPLSRKRSAYFHIALRRYIL